MSEPVRCLEVFTGAGWRRAWSEDEKAAIVAESDRPGTSISAVARRHELSASQLFTWRRLARQLETHYDQTTLRFVSAILSVSPQRTALSEGSPERLEPRACHSIEVEIAGATVRIAEGASPAHIAAVIQALKAAV